jgi:DNA-binding winged helix-turn-helix (wHTH) protein
MSGPSKRFYEFDRFRLDTVKRVLLREGEPVPLTPKAFDTLLALVQNSGRVLEKDELMQTLWPDTIVEKNNLTQNISALRKALGESPTEHRVYCDDSGAGVSVCGQCERGRGRRGGSDSGRTCPRARRG